MTLAQARQRVLAHALRRGSFAPADEQEVRSRRGPRRSQLRALARKLHQGAISAAEREQALLTLIQEVLDEETA